ncbi:MAG TPA: SCP2 sterol-binding domain-containing protein [Mycobacteriales bacterium]
MPHPFLSDAWFDAVKALAAESPTPMLPASARINMVVTAAPDGDREMHIGDGTFGPGLLEDAGTKITVPYDVAKDMFVKGDQQAAMQAFMSGKIKVEGNMAALMAMQAQGQSASADTQAKLREITLDS